MDRLCVFDIVDLFNSIVESELSEHSFAQIVESFGYGEQTDVLPIRTASSYATVCCDTEYNYSSEDFSWLELCEKICAVRIDENRLIVGIDLDVDDEDYYLPCSAFVKLLNHVKDDECFYIFKLRNGSAFGCKRSFDSIDDDNYAVSRFVPYITNVYAIDSVLEDFLNELVSAEWDEIPDLLIKSSPQESASTHAKYDLAEYDPEYLAFLHEISVTYDIDTSRQVREYQALYNDEYISDDHPMTHREVVQTLSSIGCTTGTSFDVLNAADHAEELASKVQYSSTSPQSIAPQYDEDDLLLDQYTNGAFENAEELLKEIIKNG